MIPKFRAWDKIDSKMKEVNHIEWLNPEFNDENFRVGFNSIVRCTPAPYAPDEFEEVILWRNDSEVKLMQFTGVYDKDGKEIYEDDVVRLDVLIEPVRHEGTYWVKVNLQVRFYAEKGRYFPDRLDESKVIGNIYETPGLLSGAKQ